MSNYDKYDPKVGGFRAALAADFDTANLRKAVAVSLDTDGHVVVGAAGNSGFVGVLVLTKKRYAGDVVDVMTDGEIVDLDDDFASTAGTKIYAHATTGVLSDTASTIRVGHTVEKGRLIVRFQAII